MMPYYEVDCQTIGNLFFVIEAVTWTSARENPEQDIVKLAIRESIV